VGHTWTTHSATNQDWSAAAAKALQAGVEKASGCDVEVTQVYGIVNLGSFVTYEFASDLTGMSTLDSMTRYGVTTSFTYDANGNLDTKTGGWDYDWSADNLMTTAKQNGAQVQAYTYDGLGRRVKVEGASSAMWTVSVYPGIDPAFETTQAGATTKYVTAAGLRIARIDCTAANPPVCTTAYYLSGHQGSTRQVRDASRGLVFSADYELFGKPYNVGGTLVESYKFAMEKHDDPTGLVYLRARQYDPEIGRFVSADPVLGSLGMPQTLNRYVYVGNNPLTYTDPTGELFWLAAAFVIAFLTCVTLWCTSPLGSEDFWMGLSLTPGLDSIGDVGFVQMDCTRAWNDPDWGTVGTCLADVGFAALPFVGVGLVKVGGRALGRVPWNQVDDVPVGGADDLLKRIDKAVPSPHFADNFYRIDHGKFLGYNNLDEYAEGARSLLRAGVEGKATLYRSGNQLLSLNRRTSKLAILDLSSNELAAFFHASKGPRAINDFLKAGRWGRYYVG